MGVTEGGAERGERGGDGGGGIGVLCCVAGMAASCPPSLLRLIDTRVSIMKTQVSGLVSLLVVGDY